MRNPQKVPRRRIRVHPWPPPRFGRPTHDFARKYLNALCHWHRFYGTPHPRYKNSKTRNRTIWCLRSFGRIFREGHCHPFVYADIPDHLAHLAVLDSRN